MMKRILVLAVLAIGLNGCSSWQPVENVVPSNPNCICTQEYDPVCVQGQTASLGVSFETPQLARKNTRDNFRNIIIQGGN